MTFSAEQLRRATARRIRALPTALLAALMSFAIIVAPTTAATATPGDGKPLVAAEFPADPGDVDPRDRSASTGDDRDDGDDAWGADPVRLASPPASVSRLIGVTDQVTRLAAAAGARGPPIA